MGGKKKSTKNILIAEDERAMAKALEIKLTREGFNVTVAHDGEDALNKITGKNKAGFDLLVLDLVMPKKDGFEVLQSLKEHGNKIPIIVTSNLSQEEDAKRAKSLGAKDYFIKSNVPISTIAGYIKKFLGV